jgi:hypothetical protein
MDYEALAIPKRSRSRWRGRFEAQKSSPKLRGSGAFKPTHLLPIIFRSLFVRESAEICASLLNMGFQIALCFQLYSGRKILTIRHLYRSTT